MRRIWRRAQRAHPEGTCSLGNARSARAGISTCARCARGTDIIESFRNGGACCKHLRRGGGISNIATSHRLDHIALFPLCLLLPHSRHCSCSSAAGAHRACLSPHSPPPPYHHLLERGGRRRGARGAAKAAGGMAWRRHQPPALLFFMPWRLPPRDGRTADRAA